MRVRVPPPAFATVGGNVAGGNLASGIHAGENGVFNGNLVNGNVAYGLAVGPGATGKSNKAADNGQPVQCTAPDLCSLWRSAGRGRALRRCDSVW